MNNDLLNLLLAPTTDEPTYEPTPDTTEGEPTTFAELEAYRQKQRAKAVAHIELPTTAQLERELEEVS